MIYYINLHIQSSRPMTVAIPRSMRHLLEIVVKKRIKFSNKKYRQLAGWLNQKQFDKLVRDGFLVSTEDQKIKERLNKDKRRIVAFTQRNKDKDSNEIIAIVQPFAQKYKNSKQIYKPAVPLNFKSDKQWRRLRNAVIKHYE